MHNTITLPDGRRVVCKVWDNEGQSFDRYTAAFKAVRYRNGELWWPGLAMSSRPFHPQGFGQYIEYRMPFGGGENAKRIAFADLPEDVQKCIIQYFPPKTTASKAAK